MREMTQDILDTVQNNMFVEAAWFGIANMLVCKALDQSPPGPDDFYECKDITGNMEQYALELSRSASTNYWSGSALMQDQEAILAWITDRINEIIRARPPGTKPVVGTLRAQLRWVDDVRLTLDFFVMYATPIKEIK